MATREEYIAGAAAIATIADGYIAQVPAMFVTPDLLAQIGEAINKAATAAIDAAEKVRNPPKTVPGGV